MFFITDSELNMANLFGVLFVHLPYPTAWSLIIPLNLWLAGLLGGGAPETDHGMGKPLFNTIQPLFTGAEFSAASTPNPRS